MLKVAKMVPKASEIGANVNLAGIDMQKPVAVRFSLGSVRDMGGSKLLHIRYHGDRKGWRYLRA
jgi:hypothetical protein